MDKEKNLAMYIMHTINDATNAKDIGLRYHEWRSNDREDGDELLGVSGVFVIFKDHDNTYSMESEYFKPNNVDEIIAKHLPAIKEWMSKYKE